MTAVKPPMTIEAALARIAGQLEGSWAEMAEICNRAPATVYAWGNANMGDSIPMDCAIKLDIAYMRAGGIGAPIKSVYDLKVDCANRMAFAEQAELASLTGKHIKESAEATIAQLLCHQPGATPGDLRTAIRETQESLEATMDTLAALKKSAGLDRGDSVSGGSS